MKAKGNQDLNSDSYTQGVRENMVWIPIYDLDKHTVYPTFLKEYLSKEYQGIEHIVTVDCKNNFEEKVMYTYLIAMYALDYFYGEEDNPLRQGEGNDAIDAFADEIRDALCK